MISTKILQTIVELTDNMSLSADIDSVIIDILIQRFKKKCFNSSFILDIIRIIRKSDIIYSKHKQDASACVTVMFEVEVIIIKKYDILHNCSVKKIDEKGNFICKNEHSSIYINSHPSLQTIKINQVIVVIAGIIDYDVFKPEMSIKGLPFIPIINKSLDVVYKLTVPQDTPLIVSKLEELESVMDLSKNYDKLVLKFFHEVLYPYKTQEEYKKIQKSDSLISVTKLSFKKGKTVFISRSPYVPLNTLTIINHTDIKTEDPLEYKELQVLKKTNQLVSDEDYDMIISSIIHEHIEYFHSIYKLAEVYNTMDIVKKNNNLWDIYIKHRN
jgi:hypothetical protein